jgi:hypothetical protein
MIKLDSLGSKEEILFQNIRVYSTKVGGNTNERKEEKTLVLWVIALMLIPVSSLFRDADAYLFEEDGHAQGVYWP